MISIHTTTQDLETVVRNLVIATENHGFGVLHTHDLKATLKNKGVDLAAECQVLEVCNPHHAAAVLDRDMRVCLALPCRIAVYREDGETKIGTLLPVPLMSVFGDDAEMRIVAQRVQDEMLAIIADVI